jgi:hypothetical protein
MDEIIMGKIINKNKTPIKIFFMISAIFVVFTGVSGAAANEAILFEKAYEYYLSYQPDRALELFNVFLDEYPNSSSKDAILFWKAKSLIQLQRTDLAKKIFLDIKEQYPESNFKDFAEKELENITKLETYFTSIPIIEKEDKNEEKSDTLSATGSDHKQKLIKLNEENRNLSKQLTAFLNKNKLNEEELSKATKDRKRLELLLEDEKKKYEELLKNFERNNPAESANLLDDKRILETRLKENAEKIKILTEEKEKNEERFSILKKEKEEAENRMKEVEEKEVQLNFILSKIQDNNKDWKEVAALINQLNEEIIASKKEIQVKGQKLKKTEESLALLDKKIKDIDYERQRSSQEKNEKIEKLSEEKKVLKEKLKTEQKKVFELASQEIERDALIKELAALEKYRIKLETSSERDMIKQGIEKDTELESLRKQIESYEVTVVRIGENKYSMLQIVEENIFSSRVLSKLDVRPVIWRSGNAYEDFIIEQILFIKAEERGIPEDTAKFDSIVKRYSLNRREQNYLVKYLKIEKFIEQKISEDIIDEKKTREYYEANRDDYLIDSSNKFVKTLTIKYTSEDELDKALIAIDFRDTAVNGESFESIYESRSDMLEIKDIIYGELPDWIKEKTKDIKEGEISDVISLENSFIILQIPLEKENNIKFEDVRYEVQKNLLSKKGDYSEKLNKWLKELKSEAEEIR